LNFREQILKNEKRHNIYNFILRNPGLHLRELSRNLKIPIATLNYHLRYLEKQGLIEKKSTGRFSRYYTVNQISKIDKKILGVLRRKLPRDIILYVFSWKPSSL